MLSHKSRIHVYTKTHTHMQIHIHKHLQVLQKEIKNLSISLRQPEAFVVNQLQKHNQQNEKT